MENLFYNGKNYNTTGLLQNMPNEIFVGLIGNKNIVIKNNPENKEVVLLGDNSGYTGTMTIPTNVMKVYLSKHSIIKNIKYNSKKYTITIDENNNISYKVDDAITEPEDLELKFHYIDIITEKVKPENVTESVHDIKLPALEKPENVIENNVIENVDEIEILSIYQKIPTVAPKPTTPSVTTTVKPSKSVATQTGDGSIKPHNNEFDLKDSNSIHIDLKSEDYNNTAIILKDTGLIQNSILWLTGDNRDFRGIIITPKYIKKVIFYPNSFVKVINPSGRKLKYIFVNKDGNVDKEYYYNSDEEYQDDGKYLWELCKDGKFRKYYIENYNK